MIQAELSLTELYVDDETAWLDAMAGLIHREAYSELDYASLREYLSDMARRDRREVESRLVVLLTHILKWTFQPDRRSGSWRSSIIEQRQELARLASRGTLRNHADSALKDVYPEAVERAASETGRSTDSFPAECEYSIDELFAFDPNPSDIEEIDR